MKSISFIDEPLVVRRILEPLDLGQDHPQGPAANGIPSRHHRSGVCEVFDDGWVRYDELESTLP